MIQTFKISQPNIIKSPSNFNGDVRFKYIWTVILRLIFYGT